MLFLPHKLKKEKNDFPVLYLQIHYIKQTHGRFFSNQIKIRLSGFTGIS